MKKQTKKSFLEFFEKNGHTRVKSSSLLPAADPSILFTTAGMLQFKPYFLKERIPAFSRAVSIQKCLRTTDLDNVGYTTQHHTFFEMLGNFSFNDYFKVEAFEMAIEFIHKIGLDFKKITFSVYEKDLETYKILKSLKISEDKLFFLGEEDNFWGPPGKEGVCGPCSEIYYEIDGYKFELWNIVFIQFYKDLKGNLRKLDENYVDTGMGLERLIMILEGKKSVYETSIFQPIISKIEQVLDHPYNSNNETKIAYHVIADHIRALTFILSENILPSNEGRGYVIRRILRRAIRLSQFITTQPFLYHLVDFIVQDMKEDYPEIANSEKKIKNIIKMEEVLFQKTLKEGSQYLKSIIHKTKEEKLNTIPSSEIFKLYDTLGFPLELTKEILATETLFFDEDEFTQLMEQQRKRGEESWKEIKGSLAYFLEKDKIEKTKYFESLKEENLESSILFLFKKENGGYIPVQELYSGETGILILSITSFYAEGGGQVYDIGEIIKKDINEELIYKVENVQKEKEYYFHYGELKSSSLKIGDDVFLNIDITRKVNISKNHSATHILHHYILQDFDAKQMGSFVEDTRLRFDFSYYHPLSEREINELEYKVNKIVQENYIRKTELIRKEEAKEKGALAFFNENYDNIVRLIQLGPSIELCGGTHVGATGEIGLIKITSETSIGKGIRRLEAVTGIHALQLLLKTYQIYNHIKQIFNQNENIIPFLTNLKSENKDLIQNNERLKDQIAFQEALQEIKKANLSQNIDYYFFLSKKINNLRQVYTQINQMSRNYSIVFLLFQEKNTLVYLFGMPKNFLEKYKIDIQPILNEIQKQIGGQGIFKSNIVQGKGIFQEDKVKELDEFIYSYLKEKLASL